VTLPERFEEYCREAAAPYGVSPAVHPDDFMLQRTIADPRFQGNPRQAAIDFFIDANSCADNFCGIVQKVLGFASNSAMSILDFASGYGRVTRFLPHRFPKATIVAADVHPDAVRFVESEFGVSGVISPIVPELLETPRQFDVVFALSFFTHMPHKTFGRWLTALHRQLKPGGFLIFTASGRKPFGRGGRDPGLIDRYKAIFIPASEQFDLNEQEYGTMYVAPGYVIGQLWQYVQAPIVLLEENFWWNLQDLYVVAKR